MKNSKTNKLTELITIVLFVIVIFTPLILGIITKDKKNSQFEKRSLASLPQIPQNFEQIKSFPSEYNDYFSDHFGLRDWLIDVHNELILTLKDSPSGDVTIGEEGWLFLGSIDYNYSKFDDPIGDYRNTNRYNEKELERIGKRIIGMDLWLESKGIEFMFFIAPNKHSIYDNKLPDYIKKVNQSSATDQLRNYLQKKSKVKIAELHTELINIRDEKQLYYKKDTHWNNNATNVVQFKLLNIIAELFPNTIKPQLYKLKPVQKKGGDLARFIGLRGSPKYDPQPIFEDTCQPKILPKKAKPRDIQTHTCSGKKLKALIYRDSFFTNLQSYFSRHFKEVIYIFKKSTYHSLVKRLSISKPDIVIEEWVERHLPYVPNDSYIFIKYLHRKLFKESDLTLFNNDLKKITLSRNLTKTNKNTNAFLSLVSRSKDPKIILKDLKFKENKEYIVNIKIHSSTSSKLQLFFSLNDKQNSKLFSQKNSIVANIKKGNNDIYLSLNHSSLGSILRIDPIIDTGSIEIESIIIKEISNIYQ